MGTGQCGNSDIDRARTQTQTDAAILRQSLLGNVEFGHDFQARNKGCVQRAIGLNHFAQVAIDPKAHTGVAFIRFNVNVAGAVARRLGEQCIQHADDGRIVAGF